MNEKCKKCQEPITGDPIKQNEELYCSLECANLAAGYETDEELSYFEEDELSQDLYNNFDDD